MGGRGTSTWSPCPLSARHGRRPDLLAVEFLDRSAESIDPRCATFAEIVASVERLAEAPRPAPELLRELIAVVSDAVTRRHPHFCTKPPEAAAYVKHMQDLLTHGLAAQDPRSARGARRKRRP